MRLVADQFRKHVFDDLQPYMCTVENCKNSKVLFNVSGMWARHESSHSASSPDSSECSFCSAIYQERGPAYFKHVSAHLREVSLSVLPQPVEDEEGFDSSDIDPPSSTPDTEGLNPDPGGQLDPPSKDTEDRGDHTKPPAPAKGSEPPSGSGRESSGTSPNPASNEGAPATENTASIPSDTSASQNVGSGPEIDHLDSIIDRLLEARESRPGKQIQLLEAEIRYLCTKSREIFIAQPVLLDLDGPIKVCSTPSRAPHDVLSADRLRSLAMFTDSTTTYSECLSTADPPLTSTTYSWETM